MEDASQGKWINDIFSLSEGTDLFNKLIESFPYPIQVFAPDGVLIMVNPAFIREFHIQDASMIIGKYNLLQDPTLSEHGAFNNVQEAFAGHVVVERDFKVPVHVVKKLLHIPVDEIEAIYQDISTIPLMDSTGKLICVVNILITKITSTSRAEISQAIQYIQNRWLDDFDVNELAKAVHLSTSHFSRLFKEHTAMTPREYYIWYKLNRLKERLANGTLSISQAFESCGLHYHSHYARLFKEQTGYSPSDFRKNANI